MVRSNFVKKICDKFPYLIKRDVQKIIDIVFFEITKALTLDQIVEIRGVFRFSTKMKRSYIGRNPKTGNKINVPSKRAIKFKASSILLKRLNKNFTEK
tara:strand:- start:1036 stop:1329 length:294 start_codon:yes stop_codon:yes gene_type:complete